MGEVGRADPTRPISYRLLGQTGWEEIELWDGDRLAWRRDLHAEVGYGDRHLRLRVNGARIKDRYRGAYWTGRLSVTGAALLDFQGVGFDHPEQTVWRDGLGVLGLRTVTHGDADGIELTLSSLADATIAFEADIHGYVKVGDPLSPPPHAHAPRVRLEASGRELIAKGSIAVDLPGVELRVSLERVSASPLPRDVLGEIAWTGLDLQPGREHPLFLTGRERDQSRVWTSPVFLGL